MCFLKRWVRLVAIVDMVFLTAAILVCAYFVYLPLEESPLLVVLSRISSETASAVAIFIVGIFIMLVVTLILVRFGTTILLLFATQQESDTANAVKRIQIWQMILVLYLAVGSFVTHYYVHYVWIAVVIGIYVVFFIIVTVFTYELKTTSANMGEAAHFSVVCHPDTSPGHALQEHQGHGHHDGNWSHHREKHPHDL